MEYEIQYARLATTEKLPDRFLNTQVKANADLAKTQMGEIFTLTEILTPWFTTAQIGQTIINTFGTSYYEGGSTSDLANFENALKKVNETLAQITQNGETDWIGNINTILGIIVENKIHIAQTGRAEGYIFRDGKINNLTEGLTQNNEPHPLKTFVNITSGELKTKDKILIANPELYSHIDLENLRQIVTMNSPSEACMFLAKILKKKRVNTVNVLIINLLTTEELAKLPVGDEDNTIYLDRPLESVWSGARRLWQQLVFPILKSVGKSTKQASDKSLSFTKNYLSTLQEKRLARQEIARQTITETPKITPKQEPIKKRDLFEKEFLDDNQNNNLLKDEEIKYSPELDVHYYQEQQKEKDNKFKNTTAGFFAFCKKIGNFVWQFFKNKKTRPYFLVLCAIVILVIIWLIVDAKRSSNDPKNKINLSEAQETLRNAESDQKAASQAALSGDQEKAKQLCASAIEKANPIADYPVVGDTAKQVLTDCNAQIDQSTATTRFNSLNPILTIDNPAKAVFVLSGQAYLVTTSDIFRGLISGGKPEKIASIPRGNGDFQFGVISDNIIYLYTTSQKVYELNTDTNKLDLAKVNGNWETANAGASYIGNFYLLDSVIGQIYKHPLSNGTFGAGESYVNTGGIDLKNSKSLAIDGSLFVLRGNGEVLKLQKGKLQDFTLENPPSPYSKIDKPIKIYTDTDTPSLYILDNGQKRILEYDKDGHYIHQYALPTNLGDYSDFAVSIKGKKIWVTADKSLYEISI